MSDTKQTASPPTRFIECAGDAPGKIYFDYFDEGVRILILRGPSHFFRVNIFGMDMITDMLAMLRFTICVPNLDFVRMIRHGLQKK